MPTAPSIVSAPINVATPNGGASAPNDLEAATAVCPPLVLPFVANRCQIKLKYADPWHFIFGKVGPADSISSPTRHLPI